MIKWKPKGKPTILGGSKSSKRSPRHVPINPKAKYRVHSPSQSLHRPVPPRTHIPNLVQTSRGGWRLRGWGVRHWRLGRQRLGGWSALVVLEGVAHSSSKPPIQSNLGPLHKLSRHGSNRNPHPNRSLFGQKKQLSDGRKKVCCLVPFLLRLGKGQNGCKGMT